MRPWRVTIHCSDTKNGVICDISKIREWHLARGFNDVGYHYVLQPDGEIQNGRSLNVQGAHVYKHNQGNIGICLVGRDAYTERQWDALRYTLEGLQTIYQIPNWEIKCHYEYDNKKTCPNIPITRLLTWYLIEDQKAIEPCVYRGTPWPLDP